jgi:hypothetical protein
MASTKIRPLDLAAETVVTTVSEFKSLLMAFVIPELVRSLIFFTESALAAKNNAAQFFPRWLLSISDSILTSITLVLVGRYLILGLKPDLLAKSSPWRPIALVSILMAPFWLVLDFLTGSDLAQLIYISAYKNSEVSEVATGALLFTVYSYALHALSISMIYPQFGIVAGTSDYNFSKHRSWNKQHFLRFLCVTILLLASLKMVDVGYWYIWQGNIVDYLPTTDAYFDWRKAVLLQLRYVPIDLLYVIVPSVAVSLIFNELCKSDPIL